MAHHGNQTRLTSVRVVDGKHARKYSVPGQAFGAKCVRATVSGGCCGCLFPWFTIPEGFYAFVQQLGAAELQAPERGGNAELAAGFTGSTNVAFRASAARDQADSRLRHARFGRHDKRQHSGPDRRVPPAEGGGHAEQGEDPQNLLRFVDKLGVVSLMSQLKDAQAETVRMMAARRRTSVYGLRAMDTFGKLRKIDLSKLNEEFVARAGIKVEKSSAADAVRALSEIPSAPEMDRLPGSSGAGGAKLGEAKSEEAVVASAQEVEISEHFEGQVNRVSSISDPVMVPSTSDWARAHDRDDAPQAERAVQRLRHRDHRLADTRR